MQKSVDTNSQQEIKFLDGPRSRWEEFKFTIKVMVEFIRGFRALHFTGPCVTVFGSARFEEDLIVRTKLAKATDRVIRYQYEIRKKSDNGLLATGVTAHVVTDRNHRPSRLPDRYRDYFSLPPRKIANYE